MNRVRFNTQCTSIPFLFEKDREYNVDIICKRPHKSIRTDIIGEYFMEMKYNDSVVWIPEKFIEILDIKIKKKHFIEKLNVVFN